MTKGLDHYIEQKPKLEPVTIRAEESVWERLRKLAVKKGESLNGIVVAALKKVCDEEGV